MHQLGARNYQMDMEKAQARFLPPKNKPLDPRRVAGAVKDAGFELLLLELQLQGVYRPRDKTSGILKIPGTGQTFVLVPGDSPEDQRAFHNLKPGPVRIKGVLLEKGQVRVQG